MDNFFEILIYLFIVVSFIISFLKKKKKKEDKAYETTVYQKQTNGTDFDVKKEEPSGKDILEEIQNLFNPPFDKPKESAFEDLWKKEDTSDHYKEVDFHKATTSEHEVTVSEHTVTLSEHTPTLSEHKVPIVKKPKETVETKRLDDLDDEETDFQTRVTNPLLLLRKDLKNKDSLKRYIVISEILGKPKALSR